MKNERRDIDTERLEQKVKNAVQDAVEREKKVESLSSWWRDIREGNNFRISLQELFSGD